MEIRSNDPFDTVIGGFDTIEIAAPVPHVPATFPDGHVEAAGGNEERGSLPVPLF